MEEGGNALDSRVSGVIEGEGDGNVLALQRLFVLKPQREQLLLAVATNSRRQLQPSPLHAVVLCVPVLVLSLHVPTIMVLTLFLLLRLRLLPY